MKTDLYICLITSSGLTSQGTNTDKPLSLPKKRFKVHNLIHTINKNSPHTGRIKTLALIYYFMRQKIWIPSINSAERRIRNKQIYTLYKQGISYTILAQQFHISERWIRAIIEIMRGRKY
ncbi:MAG: Mor transcription activator family protein [Brevinema sp.]